MQERTNSAVFSSGNACSIARYRRSRATLSSTAWKPEICSSAVGTTLNSGLFIPSTPLHARHSQPASNASSSNRGDRAEPALAAQAQDVQASRENDVPATNSQPLAFSTGPGQRVCAQPTASSANAWYIW